MSKSVQISLRLPADVFEVLEAKANATDYVVAALREKLFRDEQGRFRASARRISRGSRDGVEFALPAQFEIVETN